MTWGLLDQHHAGPRRVPFRPITPTGFVASKFTDTACDLQAQRVTKGGVHSTEVGKRAND